MNLAELEIGRAAKILEIKQADLAFKLKEFGIFSGVHVRILRAAPAGCPLILEAGGMQLSLRKDDAAFVNITNLEQG